MLSNVSKLWVWGPGQPVLDIAQRERREQDLIWQVQATDFRGPRRLPVNKRRPKDNIENWYIGRIWLKSATVKASGRFPKSPAIPLTVCLSTRGLLVPTYAVHHKCEWNLISLVLECKNIEWLLENSPIDQNLIEYAEHMKVFKSASWQNAYVPSYQGKSIGTAIRITLNAGPKSLIGK